MVFEVVGFGVATVAASSTLFGPLPDAWMQPLLPRYSQASSSQQGSHPRVGQRSEQGGGRGNGCNTEVDYLEHHGH